MRMMFAKHPAIAKRWANETPNIKKLPEHKGHAKRVKAHLAKQRYSK